jgi:hypothetical protein
MRNFPNININIFNNVSENQEIPEDIELNTSAPINSSFIRTYPNSNFHSTLNTQQEQQIQQQPQQPQQPQPPQQIQTPQQQTQQQTHQQQINNSSELLNNQRIPFRNQNMTGTLEIISYGNRNNNIYGQIDNITRNIIDNISNINQNEGLNINQLRQYTSLVVSTENIQEKCEICHENIKKLDILRTLNLCNHSFHQECIDVWFETNNKCPYCRGTIINSANNEESEQKNNEESEQKNNEE